MVCFFFRNKPPVALPGNLPQIKERVKLNNIINSPKIPKPQKNKPTKKIIPFPKILQKKFPKPRP
jgi:hypothetical protein